VKIISDLKRQVIRNLEQMIAPHVWPCGYGHTENGKWIPLKIFAFAPINGRDTRSMGKTFDEDLTLLDGFFEHGTTDACGGGCGCKDFRQYCLEDLLAIERWMTKNFHKEVDRSKVHRLKQ
jgi:hypothetical protein